MSVADYWNGSFPWEDDEPTVYPKRHTCKFCGVTGLKWKKVGFSQYILVTQVTEEPHKCKGDRYSSKH